MPPIINGYSTSELIAPSEGPINGSVVADKAQSEASAASAARPQIGDHVTLRNSVQSLQKLSEAVAQAPVVNATNVAPIKRAVSNGTYQVDAASIANKILPFENGLK